MLLLPAPVRTMNTRHMQPYLLAILRNISIMSLLFETEISTRVFEIELKNIHCMKSLNSMNLIHDNKLNNIAEFNLFHDILNPSKHTKSINSHYSPILYL